MRPQMIVGNWKMHLNMATAVELAREIAQGLDISPARAEVVVCPPFPYLSAVGHTLEGSVVDLGAQDGHWAPQGAHTGWVSMPMLVDVGCRYVIIGHSERRQFAQETDADIGKKVVAGLAHGLRVILCVGETGADRDAGITNDVVTRQLSGALEQVSGAEASQLILAYEPVWAIGTGKTATPGLAQEVHGLIRSWIETTWGTETARRLVILYGGSVKPDNMHALARMPDIGGALVGGASLSAQGFLEIVRQADAGKR